jgi:hypothetical protein
MRLIDNLRNVEKKGLSGVRQGMERAREEWNDVERRLRQRMRIYPQKFRNMMGRSANEGRLAMAMEQGRAPAAVDPKDSHTPIISVHGQDIDESELNKTA